MTLTIDNRFITNNTNYLGLFIRNKYGDNGFPQIFSAKQVVIHGLNRHVERLYVYSKLSIIELNILLESFND